jgi:hypothetical protein
MAKEWILNSAMNRFQLNFKKNVGPTSESIRLCEPKSLEEWRKYYFNHVRSKDHLVNLGKRLYVKITEVIHAEVEQITEEDCINYLLNMVINRTYDGYISEINTVYGQLQKELNTKIEPAPDKWDRQYNVDFYIAIESSYIGLQIKPVNEGIQLSQIFKEENIQQKTHNQFSKKFGGSVFYVISKKIDGKKKIANPEVIDEIQEEMESLKK